jgi:hypothetical protein
MTYFQNLNRLILKELEFRADRFVDNYDPAKRSIILIPGGMGSRLLQCRARFQDDNFPPNPAFEEIWIDWPAILLGRIGALGLDDDEWDHGQKPIIASGEMNSIVKSYDGTESYFVAHDFNFTEFGYDWRRDVRSAAGYLKTFLGMIKTKVMNRTGGHANPLSRLTLFAHSMGGLVTKCLINELVADDQDTRQWFHRFVSVASPFYGTETHIDRYYCGEKMVNLLLGGPQRVARMISTMPGPYGLLPAPLEVLESKLHLLGLNRYPVRDALQPDVPVDPYSLEGLMRFPKYTHKTYFARAQALFAQVDEQLPAGVYDQIFHIRNNIRDNRRPLEWRWQTIDREVFEPGDEAPVQATGGASDGTVPFWSARLADTPDDHIHALNIETDHGSLAEDQRVLAVVHDLAGESALPPGGATPPGGEGPFGPLSQGRHLAAVTTLIDDIKSGRAHENSIDAMPETMKRALVKALTIC